MFFIDLVLLSTINLPGHALTNVGSRLILLKYIELFLVLHRKGNAYMIKLPRSMRTHPTFHVCRLRPYYQHEAYSGNEDNQRAQDFFLQFLVISDQILMLVSQQRCLATSSP